MKNLFPIVFLSLSSALFSSQEISLVPQPQYSQFLPGQFVFDSGTKIHILNKEVGFAASLVRDEIEGDLDFRPEISEDASSRGILFEYPGLRTSFRSLLRQHGVSPDSKLGEEGYVLFIGPEKIILTANTPKGMFYGAQTLKQLIRSSAKNGSIPCMKIKDWPLMRIRAVLDDISRGPISTLEFFKDNIRRFAELKINALTYYTENVVRTEKHPFFAPQGALNLDEIRELSAFAKKYNVDLIGCFQSFGHFEKILEYPQYQHLGEMDALLSPAHDESYRLLADIYSELAPAYDSQYFLVLGDELWALGKGASADRVQEEGFARVFADHINWIHDELAKYGKRIVVAGDEPLKHPEIFKLLKKDIILLPWDYSPKESFQDMLIPFVENDFEIMVTPGVSCWRKLFPTINQSKINIRHFIRDGADVRAMGVVNTTWDDWGINFFSNNWYGIAFGADQSWNSENPLTEMFDRRFSAAVYGDRAGQVGQNIIRLDSLNSFSNLQNKEATVFWARLIPEYGAKAQLSIDQWFEIKKDAELVKGGIESAKVSHYKRDMDFIGYVCDQIIFMADVRISLVKLADTYRSACLNQNNRSLCRDNLNDAILKVAGLLGEWRALSERYQYLWGVENRRYWLINILEDFQVIESDFVDVHSRLGSALSDYEKGYALPSPMRVRLDIGELEGNFFQTWLMCGSFPNPKKDSSLPSHVPGNCAGFDMDYLDAGGGESGIHPRDGMTVMRPDGTDTAWKRVSSNLGAKIDLRSIFTQTERVVAYAYCIINVPEDKEVTAALGSNDGIKVFLNGEKVFESHELRPVKIDEDRIRLTLKKGQNRLLLKIDQGRGMWGFVFRLLDERTRNQGYIYRIDADS